MKAKTYYYFAKCKLLASLFTKRVYNKYGRHKLICQPQCACFILMLHYILCCVTLCLPMSPDCITDDFGNEKDGRRCEDYYNPIAKGQRHNVEHFASEFHNQYLSEEDDEYYQQEATTFANVVECRVSALYRLGIKQVPELQEYEYREEEAQLVGIKLSVALEVEIYSEEYSREKQTRSEDVHLN